MPLPPVPPRPRYAYRCVDRSRLVDPFREKWVPLFDWWVPRRLPANFITLGSSTLMWVALACVVRTDRFSPGGIALTLAILLHLYVVYDHVDGMQAKKTGTSSALGEYLDHSLDVYHGAIAVLMIFAAVGFDSPGLVLTMLGLTHLAFAATMVEEKERGELFFGVLGSLEGVLLFTAFLLSWIWPPARAWWCAPLLGKWPAYGLLIAGGAIGAIAGTADCLRRIGRVPKNFALFAASHAGLLLVLALGKFPLWPAITAAMLHAGDYTGRVIGSHLLGRAHPAPDFFGLVIALLIWPVLQPVGMPWLAWLVPGCLGMITLRGVLATTLALRTDWRWWLPSGR